MVSLKRKLLAVIVFSVGIGAGSPVLAQTTKTTWTLQECIEYSLKNNLQVKQAEFASENTLLTLKQAKNNLLPAINGSTGYGWSFGRSIDPTENTFVNQQISSNNFNLSGSVPLFNGLQLQNTIKRNRLENEAALSDVEQTKNDVVLNVVAAYTQILFSDELLQNAQLQLNTSQQQLERTQKLFRAGSVAESNIFEINSQMATDELSIINAQNQKNIAELNLIQLLDLRDIKHFEVVKPDIKDPDQDVIMIDAGEVYAASQQRMPQVTSVDLRVSSALKDIDIARGAYYPRLSLSGSISTNYSSARQQQVLLNTPNIQTIGFVNGDQTQPVLYSVPYSYSYTSYGFFNQLTDNQGKSIFLNLSIPIFNGFQVRNNVSRAIINHKLAVLNTEVVRNQLRTSIQQAFADAVAAQQKFIATKKQLAALELTYRNTEIKFNNGLVNTTDFNVARNNFTRAQSDLITAKYDYTFKLKILDFYQGKPLAL